MGGAREQLETLVDVAGIEPATPCFAMNFKNAMWLFFLAYTYVVVRGVWRCLAVFGIILFSTCSSV